ncbi:uncharacterized protein A1O9_10511 [Exophiala aquamarina CBS 119918]|uniref:Xylanolytic transcriptional activator regulatory domain-containing protein n=1 Tax=Exophiala aquamarina CBS 119918 TaxID=1182545 RepID=A0A072P109_9EURO|nr:uncharacterized protein A1O9_10511 [Exophiala aquamarina CBS 119918]KEF53536.1 hypothetical protein A1O9_10511 [Exophiala aquamarina CBS 119918]
MDEHSVTAPGRVPLIDPCTIGFPDRTTTIALLDSFLSSVHTIFTSVHANLCRQFYAKLFVTGVTAISDGNRVTHLAILALGWHASMVASPLTAPFPGHPQPQLPWADSSKPMLGEHLYKSAHDITFGTISQSSIGALTSLISLTLYEQTTRRFETAWAIFGICMRHAQALRLHRELPD